MQILCHMQKKKKKKKKKKSNDYNNYLIIFYNSLCHTTAAVPWVAVMFAGRQERNFTQVRLVAHQFLKT